MVRMTSGLLYFVCLLLGYGLAIPDGGSSDFFNNQEYTLPNRDGQTMYSRNPQANALYIHGLEYLNKGTPWKGGSLQNARKALTLFRQATQKDPEFSLAYASQAEALDLFNFSVPGSMTGVNIYREEETAARKAAELDDNLPQAHSILASVYQAYEYDWPRAEKELKRVIELTPNSVAAHIRYALFLGTLGRFEEAHAQMGMATALDAKNAAVNRAMLLLLYWEHQDDAAIAQGLQAVQKEDNLPTRFFLGLVYVHKGLFQKGIQELKLTTRLGDAGSLAALAYAYAMAGDRIGLANTLQQLKNHPARDHVAYRVAAIYVALGEKRRAISLIEKDYRQRSNWLDWLKVDPAMDPLRHEPRFKQLMRKMNFR